MQALHFEEKKQTFKNWLKNPWTEELRLSQKQTLNATIDYLLEDVSNTTNDVRNQLIGRVQGLKATENFILETLNELNPQTEQINEQ